VSQEQGIEMQIADYFNQSLPQPLNHEDVLRSLMEDVAMKKKKRSEKAIIASLLEKLETESDTVKLQVYRQALELLLRGNRF
jgi:ribosomal protein S7